jgi:hypothetical protein
MTRFYDDPLDRIALAGGRSGGLGFLFKKPVDPVRSARAKAAQASIPPEKRAEMARKAAATKKANKEAAKQRERAAYAKAYKAKVSELAAKLGRQPTFMDMVEAGDLDEDEGL